MKIPRWICLICFLIIGTLFYKQQESLAAEQQQIVIHKRVYLEQKEQQNPQLAQQINILSESYGVNDAVFAIYEVSGYLDYLIEKYDLSIEAAKELLVDEAYVPRTDLHVLADKGHVNYTAVKQNYQGIEWIETGSTCYDSFIDHLGESIIDDGILQLTIQKDKVFLVVELGNNLQSGVNSPDVAEYLLIDDTKLEHNPAQFFIKSRSYSREPYFIKIGRDKDSLQPLEGAEFVLYQEVEDERYYLKATNNSVDSWLNESDVKGDLRSDNRLYKVSSNEMGIVRADVSLKSGIYYFEEISAPSGYMISSNAKRIEVIIPESYQDAILINGKSLTSIEQTDQLPTIYNDKAVGAKFFQKIDEKTGELLAGAMFVICNSDVEYLSKSGTWISADYGTKHFNELLILISDNNGRFAVKDLPYGDYALLEIAAPVNYLLPESHFIDFQISEISGEGNEPLKIVNKRQNGSKQEKPVRQLPDKRLPQTGEMRTQNLVIMGLFCLAFVVVKKMKRRNQK